MPSLCTSPVLCACPKRYVSNLGKVGYYYFLSQSAAGKETIAYESSTKYLTRSIDCKGSII